MEEKPRKCRWCKWFNPSQAWNPREGECKKPAGDVEMQTDEFKAGFLAEHPIDLVNGEPVHSGLEQIKAEFIKYGLREYAMGKRKVAIKAIVIDSNIIS